MPDTAQLDEFSKEKLFAMYVFIEQWIEENKATKEDTAEYADKVQQLIELQIYLSEKYYNQEGTPTSEADMSRFKDGWDLMMKGEFNN